MLGIYFVM